MGGEAESNPLGGTPEIDDDVLDEACYYLSRLGLSLGEVASRWGLTPQQVDARRSRFEAKLKSGEITEETNALDFWRSIREEIEGNVKVTFVSEKGFHHSWRSELTKLDGSTLLAIYESCKDFLNMDPSTRFLEYSPPKNYDPLAMQREISKAVVVIGAILEEKWKNDSARP